MASSSVLDFDERRRVRDAWADKRRQIAKLEAEATELLIDQIAFHDEDVADAPHHRDAIYRSMIAEFSVAARVSKGAMEFAFADALALRTTLPAVRAAFRDGQISGGHVREIVRASAIVAEAIRNGATEPGTMAMFETAVIVIGESETASRTGAHARRVAAALVGETVAERHRRAADERCVTVRSVDDGLAVLTAILPEWMALAIADRLSQLTRTVLHARDQHPSAPGLPSVQSTDADPDSGAMPTTPAPLHAANDKSIIPSADGDTFALDPAPAAGPGDVRTWQQVQADLFADLLLAAEPSGAHGAVLDDIRGRVQVTVAATTLAGMDDLPGELDGRGPLHADIARALAGREGGWTRLFLDPSGQVIETDAYVPTASMRRLLRARDQHCRFPGCRVPVHRCDIDHTRDHAKGGPTRIDNLAHLCRGHHVLKHPDIPATHRWSVRQGENGTLEWRSPLGALHTDHPPTRVTFV